MGSTTAAGDFATGDINGDGIIDFACLTASGTGLDTIRIRLGDGRGNTSWLPDLVSSGIKTDVKLGDINHDGKLDLVYISRDDGTLRTRFGNGDGTFSEESIRAQLGPTTNPFLSGLKLVDMNGDGHLDAVGDSWNAGIRIAYDNGTGTFNSSLFTFDGAGGVSSLQVLDVTGEGYPDLIYTTRIADDLNVLTNVGSGGPTDLRSINFEGGLRENTSLTCTKVGNTVIFAISEIAVAGAGRIVYGRNPGSSPSDIGVIANMSGLSSVAVADFDGDGVPDLAFTAQLNPTGSNTGTVHIYSGSASGPPFGGTPTKFDTGWLPFAVDPVDVNHDGNPDMIVAQYGKHPVFDAFNVYLNNRESLVVTTTADENDGNASWKNGTGTSLREALAYATTSLTPPVITFAPYVTNTNPVLELNSPLTISTQPAFQTYTIRNTRGFVTLSGRGQHRIMNLDWMLNVENLNFTAGNSGNDPGGAINSTYFGNLSINNCTFYGNSSGTGEGSAIHFPEVSTLNIRNSTFAQNSGASTIRSIGGTFTMNYVTVAGNTGRGVITGATTAFLRNNLLSGNSGGDYLVTANTPTGSHNLIRNGSPGALTDTRTGDPLLNALGTNGGLTRTMGFAAGSAALNSGYADSSTTTDQRGVSRPQNGTHDIGAWEARFSPAPVLATNSLTVAGNTVNLASATSPNPPGGTFSGEGVSNGVFNPAGLSLGVKTITYTPPAQAGYDMVGTTTLQITVNYPGSLVVTTATDEDNGTTDPASGTGTSLREAITHANSLTGARTITFAPALAGQTLTIDKGFYSTGDVSAFVVTGQLTIEGTATYPGITLAIATGVQKRHLYVSSSGALTLANLTLTNGFATDFGGSVWSQGSLTVKGCTFTGNQANTEGGAIQGWGDTPLLSIENSTFSGNSSGIGAAFDGGALQMSFRHLTVTNNTTPSGQAVVLWKNQATFINCLIAGNSGEGIGLSNGATLTAQSTNNLLGAGAGGGLVNGVNGNILGVAAADLKLGGLAANGGHARTHALLHGSPAIDGGTTTSITVDQRSTARIQVLRPDIGAFEYIAGGLRAEYYNNRTLSSFPVVVRRDAAVNFSGFEPPAPGVNATDYSARWTGFIVIPTTGSYTFYAAADDGVRLWINSTSGTPVIDEWREQGEIEYATGNYSFTAGQRVPVKFEYLQGGGGSAGRLRWQGPSIAKAIIPANNLVPSPESPGLKAEFFNNTTLGGTAAATRYDTSLDFTWTASPAAGIGATNFSTRWTGFIDIPATGSYTFYVAADDGVRLWIGDVAGTAAINQWADRAEAEFATDSYSFTAGQRVPVKIDYYQAGGGAALRLRWQGPDISKTIIPIGVLYPPIEQAASPVFSTPAGTFAATQVVSLSSTISGGMIRYTTDGTQPTPATGLIYSSAINITGITTLRAVAYKEGYASSAVASAQYSVLTALPYWRYLHGLAADGSQDLATPVNDGVANLMKYAFNMAPTAGNLLAHNINRMTPDGTAGLPRTYADAQGRLVIQFVRRKASTNPGITYIVETGGSLTTFAPLDTSAATVVSLDATWERVTVADPAVTPERFGRVRVRVP